MSPFHYVRYALKVVRGQLFGIFNTISLKHYRYIAVVSLIVAVFASAIFIGNGSALGQNTLSGIVTDSTNNPVKFATLYLNDANGVTKGSVATDITGHYSVTVDPGNYNLRFRGPDPSDYVGFHLDNLNAGQSGTPIDLTNGDVPKDLRLNTATLHIHVQYPNGAAVSNAGVSAFGKNGDLGNMFLYPSDPGETIYGISSGSNNDAFTDPYGNVDLTTIVGEKFGTSHAEGSVCVLISGSYTCLPAPMAVSGDASITLTAPQTFTLSGKLIDTANNPVSYVSVILKASDGTSSVTSSDINGNYSIAAKPNKYSLSLQTDGSDPIGNHLDSLYAVQAGLPGIDLTTGDVFQNLQLKTATLHVIVKDSLGNLIPNTQITGSAYHNDGGTATLYATDPGESIYSAYNGTIQPIYTGADGSIDITAVIGEKFGTNHGDGSICANLDGGYICLPTATTVTGDITITLIKQVVRTLSGRMTDSDSSAIKYATLQLYDTNGNSVGSSITDVNGNYSMLVSPGVYRLRIVGPDATDYIDHHLDVLNMAQTTTTIDLTAGNVSQNLQLSTATIHVIVKDGQGNLVSNAPVTAFSKHSNGGVTKLYTSDPGNTIYTANSGTNNDSFTDLSGSVDITVLNGENFADNYTDGSLCTNVAGGYICLPAAKTVAGNETITLQAVPQLPSAPASLTAVSPTKSKPALNWSATVNPVAPASSYKVYRDNTLVGTSSSTTFTDNSLSSDGTYSYYVTAVSQSGTESANSNTISVLYDATRPTIAYSAVPSANSNAWNNSDVTITFTCNDNLSGIQACSTPVTITSEGANQTATGTATDKAGNSVSINANVNIDKTAPTISYTLSPAPNVHGYNNSDVIVTLNCADALSGVATCSSPLTLTQSGSNQNVSGTVTDKAGNSSSTTATVNLDKAAPTIAYTVNPVANSSGWNNSNVTVSFDCSDTLSGISSCSAPQTLTSEGVTQPITGTAVDKAGNQSTATSPTIRIDKIAPALGSATVSPSTITSGQSTGFTAPVSDGLSGVAKGEYYVGSVDPGQGSGTPLTLSGGSLTAIIASLAPGVQTVSYRATDVAGNWCAVQTVSVTVKPLAPTTVTALSPTNKAPVINWSSVTGADHYDIYRDGLKVGTSNSTTYTDSTAPANTSHSYYVVALTADNVASANSSSVTVAYDTTPPAISGATDSKHGVFVRGGADSISATTSDMQTGVITGEYFLGTDPGVGNGTPMTYASGQISANVNVPAAAGTYTYSMRSKDAAGNWSSVVTVTVRVVL